MASLETMGTTTAEATDSSWKRIRSRTTAVISLTYLFEKADECILPAMYKYVSRDFQASLSQMGTLSVCRGFTQALTSPIGGIAGHMMNRIHVVLYGCLIWFCMTWLFGLARWAPHPLVIGGIVWAINGLGLSLVIPNTQSVVADYYTDESRGKVFGLLCFTSAVGTLGGMVFATNVAGADIGGIEGWQLVFFSLAFVSAGVGILNFFVSKDPRDIPWMPSTEEKKVGNWKGAWTGIKEVFQVPTFLVILLQGVLGTIPWKAFGAFAPLYLQLVGMSDGKTSAAIAVFMVGCALGGLLGGFLGDWAGQLSPNHGRIFVCQFSIFIGIPTSVVIFHFLPKDGASSTLSLYMAALFFHGLLISWAAPACNNPIFAEIVPVNTRNLVYAFDRCVEGAFASPAPALVGWMASAFFGYSGIASTSGDPAIDLPRAEALGKALMWFHIVPWGLCVLFYSGLHFTYRSDKLKATYQHVF